MIQALIFVEMLLVVMVACKLGSNIVHWIRIFTVLFSCNVVTPNYATCWWYVVEIYVLKMRFSILFFFHWNSLLGFHGDFCERRTGMTNVRSQKEKNFI